MVKSLIRRVLRMNGYELLGPLSSYATDRSLSGLLQDQGIDVVLDVGANEGQFGASLRKLGYRGKIVSFEPLTTAHASLTRNASRDDLWRIAERTALGAENGMIDMHVSGNSVSSSVLNMLQSHSNAAPASAYVKSESAPIKKLDDLSVITSSDRTLLKIDVQGFESEVLRGAEDTLELCHAVILEMSLIPLYEGQASALWLWNYLVDKGFEPWSLEPGFRNPSSQRMLQCDGYFIRHKSA